MYWFVIIIVILSCALISAYLLTIRLPRDETAAGLNALVSMSWRDFINLVIEALARRGYQRIVDEDNSGDDNEFVLERGGKRWLLSCKHGSAFVLGQATVTEMASAIRMNGLAGGLLVTQGQISADARPIAALQYIELLDGPTLWPEVRDLIPSAQRRTIEAGAKRRAHKQVLLTWLIGVFVSIMLFLAVKGIGETAPDTSHTVIAAPSQIRTLTSPASQTSPAALNAVASASIAKSEVVASLDQQRNRLAEAIQGLPIVNRALWATASTLDIYLSDPTIDAKSMVCALVIRYPELASSRIQLVPPQGSEARVRFFQCRSY